MKIFSLLESIDRHHWLKIQSAMLELLPDEWDVKLVNTHLIALDVTNDEHKNAYVRWKVDVQNVRDYVGDALLHADGDLMVTIDEIFASAQIDSDEVDISGPIIVMGFENVSIAFKAIVAVICGEEFYEEMVDDVVKELISLDFE